MSNTVKAGLKKVIRPRGKHGQTTAEAQAATLKQFAKTLEKLAK